MPLPLACLSWHFFMSHIEQRDAHHAASQESCLQVKTRPQALHKDAVTEGSINANLKFTLLSLLFHRKHTHAREGRHINSIELHFSVGLLLLFSMFDLFEQR